MVVHQCRNMVVSWEYGILQFMSCTYNILRPILFVLHAVCVGMYWTLFVVRLQFMSRTYNILCPLLYVHVVRVGMTWTLFVDNLQFMSRTYSIVCTILYIHVVRVGMKGHFLSFAYKLCLVRT